MRWGWGSLFQILFFLVRKYVLKGIVGYCVIFSETSMDSFSSSLSIVSISTSFLTDSFISYLYEYMQDIIENKILKGIKKNDLDNDAIDKDDEIDSIEVDVQQEFGLTVNFVNLAYETRAYKYVMAFINFCCIINCNMRFN